MVQLHLKQFFKTSAGILSRPVLLDTFKFFSVTATFSSGILVYQKTGVWSRLLLRYLVTLLEDVFVDFVVVGRMPAALWDCWILIYDRKI